MIVEQDSDPAATPVGDKFATFMLSSMPAAPVTKQSGTCSGIGAAWRSAVSHMPAMQQQIAKHASMQR